MIKTLTCIECPKGCRLSVEVENGKAVKVTGNQCAKGGKYGKSEVENPERILTSVVSAEGLQLRMVPVRTNKPIPKSKLFEAMERIKKMKLIKPIKAGEVLEKDFVISGVDLVATRTPGPF
ncbi:MAG: DUF1667 domain-containing protein [Candidatus Margulisiibacteriota bacterium]